MEKECCPRFNPKKWDKILHKWKNKLFIKESMPTLFHIPFPWVMNSKIIKLFKIATDQKKILKKSDEVLLLFHDPSAFRSDIYLSVKKTVKGARNISMSTTLFSRVFAGPYGAVPKFIKQMNEYLSKNNMTAKDYYIHYAYCPKCAKKYGNNYMILFAEIKK
jgi:hypothetical protein